MHTFMYKKIITIEKWSELERDKGYKITGEDIHIMKFSKE